VRVRVRGGHHHGAGLQVSDRMAGWRGDGPKRARSERGGARSEEWCKLSHSRCSFRMRSEESHSLRGQCLPVRRAPLVSGQTGKFSARTANFTLCVDGLIQAKATLVWDFTRRSKWQMANAAVEHTPHTPAPSHANIQIRYRCEHSAHGNRTTQVCDNSMC
jgi:hypothetical protein